MERGSISGAGCVGISWLMVVWWRYCCGWQNMFTDVYSKLTYQEHNRSPDTSDDHGILMDNWFLIAFVTCPQGKEWALIGMWGISNQYTYLTVLSHTGSITNYEVRPQAVRANRSFFSGKTDASLVQVEICRHSNGRDQTRTKCTHCSNALTRSVNIPVTTVRPTRGMWTLWMVNPQHPTEGDLGDFSPRSLAPKGLYPQRIPKMCHVPVNKNGLLYHLWMVSKPWWVMVIGCSMVVHNGWWGYMMMINSG